MLKPVLFTLLLMLAAVVFIAPGKTDPFVQENYFILHYTPGPGWDHDKPAAQQDGFAEHSQFLSSLRSSGRAKIGGRYSDKGMIIFSARDQIQADSLLATDPSIGLGTFSAELHPIHFFYTGSVE